MPSPSSHVTISTPAGMKRPGGRAPSSAPSSVDLPASLPPTWGLLPFAALTLAVAGGVEALLLGSAPLAEMWPLHVVMLSASGLAVALPVYYHVSRYKRTSESALERKDEALARMQEYIVSASDSFPHGLAIFDAGRHVVFRNRAMREKFADSVGDRCPALLADSGGDGCSVCLIPAVLGDRTPRVQQARVDGKEMLVHASWIRSPGGKDYVMEVFTDVTDLESARRKMSLMEAQVQRADKLATLGQLAAEVAHEMNTPLANISLLTEIMEPKAENPEMKRKLAEIRRQVEIAAGTTQDLLDFVRNRRPGMELIDLNDVVRDAAWFTSERREGARAAVLDLHPGPLTVRGDPRQLQQVLINLIVNAYDAIPAEGSVRLTTKTVPGPRAALEVHDDGCGMTGEQLERAFEPFFTTKGENGTGLGLGVCKDIVERHGGNIRLDSPPGKGTTVTVLLPSAAG